VNVGRSQSQLALALVEVDAPRVLFLGLAHEVGGAVGRIVVDDQHVKALRQRDHGFEDGLDVFALLKRGNDDQRVGHSAKVGV